MSDWEPLVRILRAETGFDLGPERMPEIRAAAARAMARARVPDLRGLLAALESGRAAIGPLVDDVMVGETYFFREPDQLRLLERVLPGLAPPIFVWSAACASGEEAYSIAIVAEELGLGDAVFVLGTDLSADALAKARKAEYQEWSLRGPEAARARRFLVSDGKKRPTYRLDPRIRDRVKLAKLNLVSDPYPAGQHVIFCRNVLIYLDKALLPGIAEKLHGALVDDGWLVLASSDPPLQDLAPLSLVATGGALVYRKGEVAAKAADPAPRPAPAPRRVKRAATPPKPAAEAARPDPVAEVRALADTGATAAAEKLAAKLSRSFPMDAGLHYLRGVLLADLGKAGPAVESFRRALYLDSTLVMAWMRLGTSLAGQGHPVAAKRAFQQARKLCAALGPDDALPMGDGVTAGYIAGLAAKQEERL